ncbi:hypothetical protein [Pandoraea communis]|uniref:Phasin domain-containing protein n=1 Tax=Pandoraea communis TaxID=2508297 RepID=A0A5E4UTR3_9BURK|nr:hypothetical protein [Pandoraea communis]MDM8358027.1 hypothetical protein [Pandoraea communis]VVE03328.1 hypothetical protein PCO31111_02274 [Pandoraea communis]
MSKDPNPPLALCKAQWFAVLDAHRNWMESLQCLREMQLKTDEGLLHADKEFASAIESASDFSEMLNSQFAFINRQLAMQNLIWQGLVQMSARMPTAWAEQYYSAEKAWQRVFSDSAAATGDTECPANGWAAWADIARSAMQSFNAMSTEDGQSAARRLTRIAGAKG